MVYPEALIPGMREIGGRLTLNLWGSVYPRGGFLHQVDDHKAGAVVAQRAGDIVTRRGQLHVFPPRLLACRCIERKQCVHRQMAGIGTAPVQHLRRISTRRFSDPSPTGRLRLGAVATV